MSGPRLREIFLAFVRLHILYHADHGPVFGLGLIRELRRHGYDLSPGTLYPTLHALERQGHLRSEAAQVQGRRRRVYRTTPVGRALLREGRQRAQELLTEIGGSAAGGAKSDARRTHADR